MMLTDAKKQQDALGRGIAERQIIAEGIVHAIDEMIATRAKNSVGVINDSTQRVVDGVAENFRKRAAAMLLIRAMGCYAFLSIDQGFRPFDEWVRSILCNALSGQPEVAQRWIVMQAAQAFIKRMADAITDDLHQHDRAN